MKKPKVLVLASLYGHGGVESHLERLIAALGESMDFDIVSTRQTKGNPKPKLRRVQFRPRTSFARKFEVAVAMIIRAAWKRYDVMYVIENGRHVDLARALLLKRGGHVVANVVGDAPAVRAFCQIPPFYDILVVETNWHARIVRNCGIPEQKVSVIPHIPSSPSEQFQSNGSSVTFGYLGRLTKQKGLDLLMRAIESMSLEGVQFLIAGRGEMEVELDAWARRRGNVEVSICTWKNDNELDVLFNKIDVLILPSRSEGLPLIVLESGLRGKRFIAFDVGAMSELKTMPECIVLPKLGADKLAQAIQQSSQGDFTVQSQQAIQHAFQQRFGSNQTIQDWSNVLLNQPAS